MTEAAETSVETRRHEVAAIIARGTDSAALAAALRDSDWRVREEAILGVRRFRAKADLVPTLIAALSDASDVAFRNAAATGLALIGSTCILPLEHALPSMDADARKLVAEVCARIPTASSVAMLLRLAEDEDDNVRIAAFEALAHAAFAGTDAASRAAHLLLREVKVTSIPLRLAALQSLSALGVPIGLSELERFCDDELLAPHAVRAARGPNTPGMFDLLVKLACRTGNVAAEAICSLSASLAVARGIVFLAAARGGDDLRRALEAAASSDAGQVRAAALDLLPAVFRAEHLPLYLSQLADDATADAAARSLAALAPMIGGHLLTSSEYVEFETLPIAARILAPLLDDDSALSVSRILLVAPPESLRDVWLDVLLGLKVVATDVSWDHVYSAAQSDASAHRACELLARRVSHEPRWGRAELSRVYDSPRARAALLLGLSRCEPLSAAEAREVEVGVGGEDSLVREWSLLAAAHGVTVDRSTVISALADEAAHVVVAAVGAAARSNCVSEIEGLAVRTANARVLVAAIAALTSVAKERALAVVERRLRGSDERLAAAALSCVPVTSARLTAICEIALERGETLIVLAALRLLQDAGEPSASAMRVGLLDHERWEVRSLTASGLPVSTYRDALTRRLEKEENSSVVEAIRRSLLGSGQSPGLRGV